MNFLDVNPLNVLLSIMVGVGLFGVLVSFSYRPPVRLSETEKLFGGGGLALTPMQRLQHELDNARFKITAGEFLRVSLVLAVVIGLGVYLLSGAPLAGVMGFLLGGMSYWMYLSQKAGKAQDAYEEQLPQLVARLITGAQLGNSLTAAAEHVAEFGPLNCREDWAYISSQLKANADVQQIFRVVSERRGSSLLNSIFELLLVQQQRQIGLIDILPSIQESIEERVRTVRKARTKMNEPLMHLWVTCSAPFVAVLLVRLLPPLAVVAAVYQTLAGQLLIFVAWGITLTAFVFAYRSFSANLRRETTLGGALKAEAREPLEPVPAEALRGGAAGFSTNVHPSLASVIRPSSGE